MRIIAVALAIVFSHASGAVTLLALDTVNRDLYRIDPSSSGAPVYLSTVDGYTDLSAIAIPSPDRLYITDRDSNRLLTVDPVTGSVMSWVTIGDDIDGQARGFDVSPDGHLYGIVLRGSGIFDSKLVTIDPLSGDTQEIGHTSGAGIVEALAFSPAGVLYAVGSPTAGGVSNTLYTVDTTSAALTAIGAIFLDGSPIADIDCLTFAPDGYLYGADSEIAATQLLRIDPATAAATAIGNPGIVGFNGIGAVVPIPTSAWLFSSALPFIFRRKESGK